MILDITQTTDGRKLVLREAVRDDAADFIRAVDTVSRERRFFLRSSFDLDLGTERTFIAEARRRGDLILMALVEGELVGWVTLLRHKQEFRRHAGQLGIGVLEPYRGLGVGKALMTTTLEWAAGNGLERIELSVRATNDSARRFYESLGFVQEGYRARSIKDDDGAYDDDLLMVIFVQRTIASG